MGILSALLTLILTMQLGATARSQEPNWGYPRQQASHRQPNPSSPPSSPSALRQDASPSASVQHGRLQSLENAQMGSYYYWQPAAGTPTSGYVAKDGSRWTLFEAAGTVRIDAAGRRYQTKLPIAAHPWRYVWQIERPAAVRRTIWVSRNPDSGAVSVLYRKPPAGTGDRCFAAEVTLESGIRIVDLKWTRTPVWADSVDVVQRRSGLRLPAAVYRLSSRRYLPATKNDLILARRAVRWSGDARTARRPYE